MHKKVVRICVICEICGQVRSCPRDHHVLYSKYSRSLCYNQPIFRPSERKKRAPKAQIAKKTPFAGFFSKKLLSACFDVRHYIKSSSDHDLIRKTPDEKYFQIALCKTPCSINTSLYRRAKFFFSVVRLKAKHGSSRWSRRGRKARADPDVPWRPGPVGKLAARPPPAAVFQPLCGSLSFFDCRRSGVLSGVAGSRKPGGFWVST